MDFEKVNKIAEEELGTSLDIADKASVSNLNDMPSKHLEVAKKSDNPFVIETYLKFFLQEKDWKYVRAFVHQVVLGQREAKSWRVGQILIPDVSLKDQLTKLKEELYGEYVHKIEFIMKPDFYSWTQGVSSVGGFVFPEPEANYTSLVPKGFLSGEMDETSLLKIDTNNVDVVFRRWIAARIARYAQSKNTLNNLDDLSFLETVADRRSWTPDAEKALIGLIKEGQHQKWREGDIPGFCGPDDFYR